MSETVCEALSKKRLYTSVVHQHEYSSKSVKELRLQFEFSFSSVEEREHFQERVKAAKRTIGGSVNNTKLISTLLDAF